MDYLAYIMLIYNNKIRCFRLLFSVHYYNNINDVLRFTLFIENRPINEISSDNICDWCSQHSDFDKSLALTCIRNHLNHELQVSHSPWCALRSYPGTGYFLHTHSSIHRSYKNTQRLRSSFWLWGVCIKILINLI